MSAGDRRGVHELARSTARGLAPPTRCERCRRVLELELGTHDELGPGERGYTCPACGARHVFYSADWLTDTEV